MANFSRKFSIQSNRSCVIAIAMAEFPYPYIYLLKYKCIFILVAQCEVSQFVTVAQSQLLSIPFAGFKPKTLEKLDDCRTKATQLSAKANIFDALLVL